ncbi:DUF4247 domain-containing protein [Marinicrinis sediminis]|uniref:DUF4247 domain-containing protein n=1 Tax=Marinicrinis sediminis TaxID=1652465 RepID=A0ABW5REP0_9BACL
MNSSKRMVILLLVSMMILTACGNGGLQQQLEDTFVRADVVYNEQGSEATIYRSFNSSVAQTVQRVQELEKPLHTSKNDSEHMFLVYEDHLVHVMQDAAKPQNTLVELSDKQFVQQSYSMGLLETYLILQIVDEVFDLKYKKRKYAGTYGGYVTTGGNYAKNKSGGSLRYGSVSGYSPRGRGPGVGK